MIWREKRLLLIVVGVILLANLLFFVTYRVQYQERVDDLHTRLEQAQSQLETARERRLDLQGQLDAHDQLVRTIEEVFDKWWSTPDERLTRVIKEVQALGVKSGMVPRAMSFSNSDGNSQLGTTTMGISFNVEGTYQQARQMINLIELSDEFLIIDSIGLQNQNDNRLTLNIALKTLFRGGAETPESKSPAGKPENEG